MTERAMAIAERLRLGGDVYLWRAGHLQDLGGRDVPLRAKSLKMFAALLAEHGTVVSKDRLSDLVWPNSVATDESIAQCVSDIRKALNDETHGIVETFPKQGYRLNVAATPNDATAVSKRWWAGALAIAAFCALAVIGLTLADRAGGPRALDTAALLGEQAPSLRNSVAILPFAAGSDADKFLAAGLADDLEIHLTEISGIRVLSQAQSSAIAGGAGTPVELARSLDARYIVEGNLRQSGTEIALALRLIDGTDGATLWADRYEGARDGLMAFRNKVPEALVKAMAVDLSARDSQRLAIRDTADPEALENVMHARRALSMFTYEGSLTAEKQLRQAIARDPQYARAYAELAAAFVIRMENDWIVLSGADTAKAFYFAEKALELDPDLWFGHYALGRLHSVSKVGNTDTALRHLRIAMELQPANDDARIYYAIVTGMSGELDEATRIFDGVLATHPQPPFWYYLGLANALFHQGRNEDALEAVKRCLNQMPNSPYCLRIQIAILARLGRIEDAEWAIEEYAMLGHDPSLASIMEGSIERTASMRAHLVQSYKLVGLE